MSKQTVLICDAPGCNKVLKDGIGYEVRVAPLLVVDGLQIPAWCGVLHVCDDKCLAGLFSKENIAHIAPSKRVAKRG